MCVCVCACAQVLGRCDHPAVVKLLAACLTPPRMCLVMELCETSLEALIYGRPGQLLELPTVRGRGRGAVAAARCWSHRGLSVGGERGGGRGGALRAAEGAAAGGVFICPAGLGG